MIGFLAKAVVSGTVIYGVIRILEETKILEKGVTAAVELVDGLLTKIDQSMEGKGTL